MLGEKQTELTKGIGGNFSEAPTVSATGAHAHLGSNDPLLGCAKDPQSLSLVCNETKG